MWKNPSMAIFGGENRGCVPIWRREVRHVPTLCEERGFRLQ